MSRIKKIINIAKSLYPARLSKVANLLLKDEAISGKLILVAVGLALIAANSSIAPWYNLLLNTNMTIGIGSWSLSLSLAHWVSEGLMTFFFLVVGLELKRELVNGEVGS